MIDFGLSTVQTSIEDKAVDLYVFERAVMSTHPGTEALVSAALESYRFACRQGTLVLLKLDQVNHLHYYSDDAFPFFTLFG